MLNANTYVTKEEGIGGTIRNRWEDFYVEEIPEVIPDGWKTGKNHSWCFAWHCKRPSYR